jgi:transposase-like protein
MRQFSSEVVVILKSKKSTKVLNLPCNNIARSTQREMLFPKVNVSFICYTYIDGSVYDK